MIFFIPSFWLVAGLLFLNACAYTLPSNEKSVANTQRTNSASTASDSNTRETSDLERLAHLWQSRTRKGSIADYPIGPGDVLEISVPAMEEVTNRTVRVTGEGTISLPFIGVVHASRLTEKGLREEIRRRLQENYMYDPQVNLFVREYRSRQVAVLGAVRNPGLYSLASADDTLLDMISQAGGMTLEAAPRINFIPAESPSTLPVHLANNGFSRPIVKHVDPIVIGLKNFNKGGRQTYVSMPARPGDVIMIPGRGEVLVKGWVARPGAHKITPGLTVLGAVAATGGSTFPADTSKVKVIRTSREGGKIVLLADLVRIKRGEEPDILVQEADVVEVPSNAAKLAVYRLYVLGRAIVRITVGGRVRVW